MHSQVTPPLRPYETPTPPDSEGEDEPEEEEENEEEEVESVFIPISFSVFTLLPLFFPGGVGGRENSEVRDTSKRLLLLLVDLGPQQHAGGAGRGLRVGNFGIFVVLVLGFRSASTMGDSPRGGSAAAPFPSLLFLLLIILIITISRSSCRRRLAGADMESLSEVSTRGGLWRSRFRHHHRHHHHHHHHSH